MEIKNGKTSLDNKFLRNFLRGLAGILLLSYTVLGVYQKWNVGEVNFDSTDMTIISVSIAVWIAVEAVRAYVVRKLDSKE